MAETPIQLKTEPESRDVRLSGGRVVSVRAITLRSTELPWPAHRPGWGDAIGASAQVLSRRVPDLSTKEVAQLEGADRRRLMIESLRLQGAEPTWKRLYGTSLGPDERYLAAMRWAQQREALTFQRTLRDIRRRLLTNSDRATVKVSDIAPLRPSSMLRPYMDLGTNRMLGALGGQSGIARIIESLQTPSFARQMQAMPFKGIGAQFNFGASTSARGIWDATSMQETLKSQGQFLGIRASSIPDLGPQGFGSHVARMLATPAWQESLVTAKKFSPLSEMVRDLGGVQSILSELTMPRGLGFADQMRRNWPTFDLAEQVGRNWPTFDLAEHVGRKWPTFDLAEQFRGLAWPTIDLGSRIRTTIRDFVVIEFGRRWSSDPFWHLVGLLKPWQLPGLLTYDREEVVALVLDALETIAMAGRVTSSISEAIEEIGFLSSDTRERLSIGLRLVSERSWASASLVLLGGLEGALRESAEGGSLQIAAERPNLQNAKKILMAVEIEPDFRAFVAELVYDKTGQRIRHGRGGEDNRRKVLLALVGLVGWIDLIAGTSGMAALAEELETPLASSLGPGTAAELERIA